MLPDLKDCNYFRKSHINYNGKEGEIVIYRLATSPTYTFVFSCLKCGKKNDFQGEMVIKKTKEGGKNKEYVLFDCKNCAEPFELQKLKAAGVKGRKPV